MGDFHPEVADMDNVRKSDVIHILMGNFIARGGPRGGSSHLETSLVPIHYPCNYSFGPFEFGSRN